MRQAWAWVDGCDLTGSPLLAISQREMGSISQLLAMPEQLRDAEPG